MSDLQDNPQKGASDLPEDEALGKKLQRRASKVERARERSEDQRSKQGPGSQAEDAEDFQLAYPVDETFRQLSQWVVDQGNVSKETRGILDEILASNIPKLKIVQQVIAAKKVKQLGDLMSIADKAHEELYKPKRIEGATTPTLVKLLGTMYNGMESSMKSIQAVINDGGPGLGAENLLSEMSSGVEALSSVEELRKMHPTKREKIRNMLQKLEDEINADPGFEEGEFRIKDELSEGANGEVNEEVED